MFDNLLKSLNEVTAKATKMQRELRKVHPENTTPTNFADLQRTLIEYADAQVQFCAKMEIAIELLRAKS